MTARDLFIESNPEAACLAGDAEISATVSPSSGCCGSCGEWSERPTGFGNCTHSPIWRSFSPKAPCAFTPAKWVPMTPERQARRDAQAGIDRAAEAADRHVHGWTDSAFEFVKRFAAENRGKQFIGSAIVKASLLTTLPQPPNPKAWGEPIQRAVRRGILVKAGYAPDPDRHNNPVPLWEVAT